MLTHNQLPDLLHDERLSREDRLLLVLAVDADHPKQPADIRDLAVAAGLREVRRWNIATILQRSKGRAIRTPTGWVLTAKGRERVSEVAPRAPSERVENASPIETRPALRAGTGRLIFLSHSGIDSGLARAFQRMLEEGIGIRADQVFCSSLRGQGVPAGHDFKSYIREQRGDSHFVVALISPNYYASAFCMCELGAVWFGATRIIPVVVPPLDVPDLGAVLEGTQGIRAGDAGALDELRDERSRFVDRPYGTSRWTEAREFFLAEVNRLTPISAPRGSKRPTRKRG